MHTLSKEIVNQINQGNTKAFKELYTTYYVYLCAVAIKYVYQPEVAQEIVNDVFMNVWNNKTQLIFPVKAYLVRAVKNRCLNHLSRNLSQEVPLTDVQEQLLKIQERLIDLEDQPLAYLENKEFEELIYEAVKTLPPKCRLIFEQYLYQNKSYEEIAKENDIATSTVRVQVKLGLSKIRAILGDFYPLFLLLFNLSEK